MLDPSLSPNAGWRQPLLSAERDLVESQAQAQAILEALEVDRHNLEVASRNFALTFHGVESSAVLTERILRRRLVRRLVWGGALVAMIAVVALAIYLKYFGAAPPPPPPLPPKAGW